MQLQQQSQFLENPSAERALLGNSAISSHPLDLINHLKKLGYPQNSIDSMQKCGTSTCQFIMSKCSCSFKVLPLTHHCNLRTCPVCSLKRKRRIRNDYLPILNQYTTNRRSLYSLKFLTISPDNYTDSKEGQIHIRKTFQKFLRNKYIKERIKGGIYVIESNDVIAGQPFYRYTKTGEKYIAGYHTKTGWNVHIHCIILSRRLDNQIRGYCHNCGQNYIKHDYQSKKYYCANRSCNNTENLDVTQDSTLVQIWQKISGRPVNMDIKFQKTSEFTLNYMLKYISVTKDNFTSSEKMAEYIFSTRKQKLINKFGIFFDMEFGKQPCICRKCKSQVEFIYDMEIIRSFFSDYRKYGSAPPTHNYIINLDNLIN